MKKLTLFVWLLCEIAAISAQTEATNEKIMLQIGGVFRHRSNNSFLYHKGRIGFALSASHYFPVTKNQKIGIRPELMFEGLYNRGKIIHRDIDGLPNGETSSIISEYSLISNVLVEAKINQALFVGSGLSFPLTLLHYMPQAFAPQGGLNKTSALLPITSYRTFGINIPVYVGTNIGKHISLSARFDRGITNRKKTLVADYRQYDSYFRLLLGIKF